VDWTVTVGLAIAFVLAFQAEVAKPYRIPSSSMEPTLHCAQPAAWCSGTMSDRVIANRLAYRFRERSRGEIVAFRAPRTESVCGAAGVFVKRLVGLPGERVSLRRGHVVVDSFIASPSTDPRSLLMERGPGVASGCLACFEHPPLEQQRPERGEEAGQP